MPSNLAVSTWREKYPAVEYVAPFACFFLFLTASSRHFLNAYWELPIWVLALAAICLLCWPRKVAIRLRHPLGSVTVGALVFFLWIAPDVLIPGYRRHFLFSNSITGHLHSSIRPAELQSAWVLSWRTIRAVLIVPVVEELFWRGWLMRWLINPNFQRVPLGQYAPLAFWVTALLFASEHGPYWDVGLVTGVIYNLWMIRTRSLPDCILMHAVTNGILSGYVVMTGQWQYWQ